MSEPNAEQSEPQTIASDQWRQDAALRRARNIVKDYAPQREFIGQRMVVAEEWAFGNQWAQLGTEGSSEIIHLPQRVYDPHDPAILITDNQIRGKVNRVKATLALPDRLPLDAEPATFDPKDYNAAIVAAALPQRLVELTDARTTFDDLALSFLVYPTAYLSLERRVEDDLYAAVDSDGNEVEDSPGVPMKAPGNTIRPGIVYPHQVSFDTANGSSHMDDHELIDIQAPMTLDRLAASLGMTVDELTGRENFPETTWGQITAGQDTAAGSELTQSATPDADQSKTRAVMTHWTYFRHPSNKTLWPTLLVWLDAPLDDKAAVLFYGDNPIFCCPLYRFAYQNVARQVDGQSLVEILMPDNAFRNVTLSQIASHMANCTAVFKTAMEGSLDETGRNAFQRNQSGELILYKDRGTSTQPPGYLKPPDLPQTMLMMLDRILGNMNDKSNDVDVVQGKSPTKRDIGFNSMQFLTNNALAPIEDKAGDVQREFERLFRNWVFAFGRLAPVKQLRETVGPTFTQQAISDFRSACLANRCYDVKMEQNSLLPRNRQQRQALFNEAMSQTLSDGRTLIEDQMLRALFGEQTGVWLDDEDREAIRGAVNENRRIAAGLDVPMPGLYEPHPLYIKVHLRLYLSAGFREQHPDRWELLGDRIETRMHMQRGRSEWEKGGMAVSRKQIEGMVAAGQDTQTNPAGTGAGLGAPANPEQANAVQPEQPPLPGPEAAMMAGPSGAVPSPQ